MENEGVIYVDVPNDFNPLQAYLVEGGFIHKKKWIIDKEHISYFGKDSLTNLAKDCGLEPKIILGTEIIEFFGLNPDTNYYDHPEVGHNCHAARRHWTKLLRSISLEKKIALSKALGDMGLGRNLIEKSNVMKNVILTGVSRGLGRCLLFWLSKQKDVHVYGVGRNSFVEKEKVPYTFIPWNLLEPENAPCIDDVITGEGQWLDFINNAGTIVPIGEIGKLSNQQLREAVQINFVSPMLFCNQLVGFCRRNKKNLKIINISSGAANHPIAGWGAYCSTKAAFKMFLDVLAEQGKVSGDIEVIHVDPGVMDTGMQEQIRSSTANAFPRIAEFCAYKKDGKLRDPDDVAQEIIRKYIL